jgi:Fur family transcriptional regulator, ferric uptake regulator
MTNKPGDNLENKSPNTSAHGSDDEHIEDREGEGKEDREGFSKAGKKAGRHGQSQESISTIVKSFPKGTHVTAAEVYERAIEMGYELSLSTVYRNLHRLKADGNVNTVSGDRGMRYEPAEEGPDHDHLICLGCGLTIEFIDDLIRGFGKSVAQRKGFEHRSSRFDILGYCGDCRAKDETYRLKQVIELIANSENLLEDSLTSLRQSVDLIDSRKSSKAQQQMENTVVRLTEAVKLCQQALAVLPKSAEESS